VPPPRPEVFNVIVQSSILTGWALSPEPFPTTMPPPYRNVPVLFWLEEMTQRVMTGLEASILMPAP
jgi:hypothetical protein